VTKVQDHAFSLNWCNLSQETRAMQVSEAAASDFFEDDEEDFGLRDLCMHISRIFGLHICAMHVRL
jgi:hypothetical protein